MSYEWIRRRQRFLGFRYLFPEVVAPWIQCKRGLLRVVWFFTHPVDDFFETIGEFIAWPFVAMAVLFAWISAGVREFFDDLLRGIRALLRYLGKLPIWTGAAVAGALGVILTTLLFFPLIHFRPVTASIPSAAEPPSDAQSESNSQQPVWRPEPDAADLFDPFAGAAAAGSEVTPSPEPDWRPEVTMRSSTETRSSADLFVQVERLSMPRGWDARRQTDVVSTSADPQAHEFAASEDRPFVADGWRLARAKHTQQSTPFVPYLARHGIQSTHTAPNWVTAAESVNPLRSVDSRRQPAVRISRSAPTTAQAGESLTYELIVENPGTQALDSVTIREAVSALDRVLNVHPPAGVVGTSLFWNITDLEPHEQRRLAIELKPDQPGPVTGGCTIQVTTGIAAVSRVSAPRPEPPVITTVPPEELMAATPPSQTKPPVEPRPPIAPDVELILPTFDEESPAVPELEEPEPVVTVEPAPAEPAKRPPGLLLPVEDLQALAIAPAHADDEPEAEAPIANVPVVNVPIHFEVRTPKSVSLDAPVPAVFEIRNPGAAELTDLVIQVQMTNELMHEQGRILKHRIARLAPGEVYQTRLTTTAVEDGLAHLSSTLTAAEELETTIDAAVEIGGRSQSRSSSIRPVTLPTRPLTCGW